MPNRVIKDSIRTSKSVNALSDFQFRVWLYLITYVDDYGRGSADPELLKGLVFTRRKGVTEVQIQKAIADLANAGMINLYEVDGEPFLYFPNWHEHQRIRDCKPKFPAPPENDSLRQPAASCGESPPESESESESEYNPNPNTFSCTEQQAAPVLSLTLNDKSEYPIFASDIAEYRQLYPAVNVSQEFRNMKGWLNANPAKRKTKSGIKRFINSWLAREQNKPRGGAANAGSSGRAAEKSAGTEQNGWGDLYDN